MKTGVFSGAKLCDFTKYKKRLDHLSKIGQPDRGQVQGSLGSFFRPCFQPFLCSPHSPFVYILTLLWEILVGWQEFLNTCNYFRGQIKFSDPTYFVPYSHHSFVSPHCYSAPRVWWTPASCFGALTLLQRFITLHPDGATVAAPNCYTGASSSLVVYSFLRRHSLR